MNLETSHSSFTATAAARTKSRDLFSGNEVVKAKGQEYLFKEKNESQDNFDLRLKRAVLDPYVPKIVQARQSLLFSKGHSRKLPKSLEQYQNDVDRQGSTASTFFAEAAQDAQVDGIHWVLVDKSRILGDATPASKLAEQQAGIRPFFQHVPAGAVRDFEVGDDNKLLWATITQETLSPRPIPGDAIKSRTQFKVWTRTEWVLYEKGDAGGASSGEATYVVIDRGPNPTGVVPLVPFYGVKHLPFSGWPVTMGILDHVILIYNKESDLDWFERLASHPIPYTISPMKPELLDVGKGFHIESTPSGEKIEVGFIETSGSPFESIRTSIDRIIAKIFSIALAQAKKDSAQVQSGDSLREDRKMFTASLTTGSIGYQNAEKQCWGIMGKWVQEAGAVEVEYSRDYDDRTIEATMLTALNGLADSGRLTTKTLLNILKQGEVLPDAVDVDTEVKSLEADSANTAAATLAALKQQGQ